MRYSTCCILFLITLFTSCSKNKNDSNLLTPNHDFIKGADLSFVPQLEDLGIKFYNEGAENDIVSILKEQGMNTVRIRLWHTPTDKHSSFAEVVQFANRLKNQNLKVWLCVHYSDTWADPAHQNPPQAWQGLSYEDLKDSLYNYTSKIVTTIQPDYIQIGNEINPGLLLPQGYRFAKPNQFIELLKTGIEAVRNTSTDCKIMIHYAGYANAYPFYNEINTLDFDLIALSYYPLWHGKNLSELQSSMNDLQAQFSRKVIIAETAYPFTLDWNDWTNNIVGLDSQLILPDYPATPTGQEKYLNKIKEICQETNSMGFCYWGAEYIAFDGPESSNGSSWENQALFDFNNEAVPAVSAFSDDLNH